MNRIEFIIAEKRRNEAIKKITHGLGKITEDETTIYCYVDEKKFKENCNYGNIYGFNLNHHPVTIYRPTFPSLYGQTYSLVKNIVYIFDNITFDKPLSFYITSPSHNYIKFQNCSFTDRISVNEAENVEFISCKSRTYNIRFFADSRVKNLKFIDDNTLTATGLFDHIYIDINSDTLEMHNTEFYGDEPKINVKNLIMKNSVVCSDEKLEISADKINLEESGFFSTLEIYLNTKECNDFSSIKAENIIYNGLSLFKHNDSYEEIDKLIETRQSLVDTLESIKVTEESYQNEEVSRYRKELKSSPLTRRLTKKDT